MACPIYTISSNLTGLSYAEEECLKQLPANPVFYELEPNSYADFGAQLAMVVRNPINPSRQRQKGAITDLDASGGLNQDLTYNNLTRLLQGFFCADIREKNTTAPMNGVQTIVAEVSATGFEMATARTTPFVSNSLIFARGFGVSSNNGLFHVVTDDGTSIETLEPVTAETVGTIDARLDNVGFEFPSGDLAVVMVDQTLTVTSVVSDFTTYGFIPGEWVYIGGDDPATRFDTNFGFARISKIEQNTLTFDKTGWEGTDETGTGKTIQMFYGDVLKNESDPALIKRRTYTIERTLGEDEDGEMSELLVGAVCNQLTMNINQADKINMDLAFVACDQQLRPGNVGPIPATHLASPIEDLINTSTDVVRANISEVVDSSYVKPLFAFADQATIVINNNVNANKAIGTLGAFDVTLGTFAVSGALNCYFANLQAVAAVRNNADVTVDYIFASKNEGMIWDMGLVSLGDGRLQVEVDQAIMLNLDQEAVANKFNNTLLFNKFAYLPDIAMQY